MKGVFHDENSSICQSWTNKLVDIDKPQIQNADDVIIRVVRNFVCGSDL